MPASQGTDPGLRRERIVHKAESYEAAAAWDREQHLSMTPEERRHAARVLKSRAFPPDAPDVRACRDAA